MNVCGASFVLLEMGVCLLPFVDLGFRRTVQIDATAAWARVRPMAGATSRSAVLAALEVVEAELRRRGDWAAERGFRTLTFAGWLQHQVVASLRRMADESDIVWPHRAMMAMARAMPERGALFDAVAALDAVLVEATQAVPGAPQPRSGLSRNAVLDEIEAELHRLGWWSEQTPAPMFDQVARMYLAPDRYLQWVLLPQVRAGTYDGDLPTLNEGFHSDLREVPKAGPLLGWLRELAPFEGSARFAFNAEPPRVPTVEVATEDLNGLFAKRYAQLGSTTKVPGFARGQAPAQKLRELHHLHVEGEVDAELTQMLGPVADPICSWAEVREGEAYRVFVAWRAGDTALPLPFRWVVEPRESSRG